MSTEEKKQAQAEQEQATNQEQDTVQDTEDQASESIDEKIEKALEAERKKYKSQLDGLNRKNNELQKQLSDAEKAKMSEEERIKAELEEAKQEKERIEKEAGQFRRQLTVEKMVRKYNLPERFADRLKGDTDDDIEADAKSIADFFSQEVQRQASETVNQKLSGKAPKGGESADVSSFQAQYDAAKQRNDVAAMLAISQRASQAGETLKEF